MSRIPLSAAALLLGLAAAPAFAQTMPASGDSAARTMQQNQRAFIPPPARPQVAQEQWAKSPPATATLPSVTGRRLALAEEVRR